MFYIFETSVLLDGLGFLIYDVAYLIEIRDNFK